jgi:DNA-binding beta-propeller fold protein YncE
MKPKFVSLLLVLYGLFASFAEAASPPSERNGAFLYAVGQSANLRGSISVYDIVAEHRLIKTIPTVPGVGDVRGVAASAVTGKLYVAYIDVSGTGMVYCLNIYDDTILWHRPISPGVDRLAINPNGQLLYVPTWEGGSADHINVLDANNGEIVGKYISPIDRTTRSTRYLDRFSKRRKPTTEPAIISI